MVIGRFNLDRGVRHILCSGYSIPVADPGGANPDSIKFQSGWRIQDAKIYLQSCLGSEALRQLGTNPPLWWIRRIGRLTERYNRTQVIAIGVKIVAVELGIIWLQCIVISIVFPRGCISHLPLLAQMRIRWLQLDRSKVRKLTNLLAQCRRVILDDLHCSLKSKFDHSWRRQFATYLWVREEVSDPWSRSGRSGQIWSEFQGCRHHSWFSTTLWGVRRWKKIVVEVKLNSRGLCCVRCCKVALLSYAIVGRNSKVS
jgi:hypothetical protein